MCESSVCEPVDTEDWAQREGDKVTVGSKVLKNCYLELHEPVQNKLQYSQNRRE